MVCVFLTASCVVPLDIAVEEPPNVPPQIDRSGSNPQAGALTIWQRTPADVTTPKEQDYRVKVYEPDAQNVTLRLFRDGAYGAPVTVSEGEQCAPDVGQTRNCFVILKGLCDDIADNEIHALEIYVTDGRFSASAEDLRTTEEGAQTDNALWRFRCEDML
jgi:hypothetical protein